jgi:hypothetical protein
VGLADDLRDFLGTLDREHIAHMLVGGVAMEALGGPRSTLDVDLQIDLPNPGSSYASTFLGAIVEERSKDEVFGQEVIIVHLPTSPVPFELFLTSHWFTRQALARRRAVRSGLVARDVPVPTLEDFILLKAAYMRGPTRPPRKAAQDAVDIETVLQHHGGKLDRGYVEANARKLGVWDALRPMLA